MNELQQVIRDDEARVNITYGGGNGDMVTPVPYAATDHEVKAWATEVIQNGGLPGVPSDPNANLHDFVVDRIPARDGLPNRLIVRSKTPFGVSQQNHEVK